MSFFEKIIRSAKVGYVKLVTTDPCTHMNIVVNQSGDEQSWEQHGITLTVDKALQVRDALNEAYPLPKAEPEPSEYKSRQSLQYSNRWEVYRDLPTTKAEVVSISDRPENAKKIAQALNEAEGL